MADRRENHGSSVSILYFFRHFDFPKSTVHCTGLLFLFQAPLHKNLISAHEMRYDGKSDADATKLKPRVFPELNYTFWNTDVLLGSAHIVCSMFALLYTLRAAEAVPSQIGDGLIIYAHQTSPVMRCWALRRTEPSSTTATQVTTTATTSTTTATTTTKRIIEAEEE